MALLEDELKTAESFWRPIVVAEQPLFGDLPIETVPPNPKHKRHWMFATNNRKILAHVYKPEYVLKKFEEVVVPLFREAYGFPVDKRDEKSLAKYLVRDVFDYLLFHELFHPVFCPKSTTDMEKFDVALKNGIRRAEPHLQDPDIVNKAGNSRNAFWDFFIDTFFQQYGVENGVFQRHLQHAFQQRNDLLGQHRLTHLPDGVITPWDVVELADHQPETLFYPITRAMYSLLFCQEPALRTAVFDYFRNKMGRMISDRDLETAIISSFFGAVKYIDARDLTRLHLDKQEYLGAAASLFTERNTQEGSLARGKVVRAITELGIRTEYRYPALEGIVEPLSKFIHTQKEEKRDGAYTEDQEGEGDAQTPQTHSGGGAEQVLQSMINQNDSDLGNMLPSIANDPRKPKSRRSQRLSNLAKDEFYKRNAREIPIKSPRRDAVTLDVGMIRRPYKIQELLLTPEQVINLPLDNISQFQLETGIQCLFELSPHQYRYDIYEWREEPIKDFTYVKSGIVLPDNLIFRVDGSGSMLIPGGEAFVGSKNRYDMLMHVVYGIAKSVSKAAQEMSKEIQVLGVSYSDDGCTQVSNPLELQAFYTTPNNEVKQVLLNPQGGSTYHDLPAYQEPYRRMKPGKTLEITIADGDLDTDHTQSIAEVKKILSQQKNHVVYFPIFQEGTFAGRIRALAPHFSNLTYLPFLNFDALQAAATGIIIQYAGRNY